MVNKKPQTKLDCDDNEKVTHLRWLTDDKIALALHSDEEAHHFMIWLGSDISCTSPSKNGDFSMTRNKWNSDNTTELHETTKYPYQHRIHASMLVLNAVRDASRGFLSSKSHSSDDIRITPAKPVTTKAAYDSAFPSLPMTKAGNPQKPYRADTPNVLIGRKKNTKKTVPIEKNSRFFQEASIKQVCNVFDFKFYLNLLCGSDSHIIKNISNNIFTTITILCITKNLRKRNQKEE